jgi:FkbM family methyltransferase
MKKRKLKLLLKKLPLVRSSIIPLYRIYRKLCYPKYNFDVPSIWIRKLLSKNDANIVQIGSNDGKYGDPLSKLIKKNTKWKALFVEPVPYLFERLKTNYGSDSRFSFENAAINDGRQQVFYSVKEEAKKHIPNLPIWYDQLGSFDKENLLKHLDGHLEPFIKETLMSGITLKELFQKNNIQHLDLLNIDTEGYDWKILSQLDLDSFNPEIILFEHKHLTKSEKINSINFLKSNYSIFELEGDFICLHNDLESKIILNELKGKRITKINNNFDQ